MKLRTLPFVWSGEAMVPDGRFRVLAARQFKQGERYVLEPHEAVTHKEQGFYRASIREAWRNLSPEAIARYPTPKHLSKWALIKAGWYTEDYQVFDSEARANWVATKIRNKDEFAVVTVKKNIVRIYTARSQTVAPGEMTLEEWRQSKRDVLDILSGFIGVSRKALEKEGRVSSP